MGPVVRDDGAVPSHKELRWLFRQDNSSFSFLAQRRVGLGFSSSLPDGPRRRVTRRERTRFAIQRARVGDATMIHTRKEIRLVGAKRGKDYRYRNPGKNLRRARLAMEELACVNIHSFVEYFTIAAAYDDSWR